MQPTVTMTQSRHGQKVPWALDSGLIGPKPSTPEPGTLDHFRSNWATQAWPLRSLGLLIGGVIERATAFLKDYVNLAV